MLAKRKGTAVLTALTASSLIATAAFADEAPTADDMPLSEVIKAVEDKGYERVSEVSLDDGVWEIEAYKDDEERELQVDPSSGEIISDEKD